jgi:hypothetical protein
MAFFRRLFGGGDEAPRRDAMTRQPDRSRMSEDEQAVERYRYMLRTAPPETIEQAHAEAFVRLTPDQRRLALQELSANVPESERAGASSDPQALARMATRAEMRQPGTLERAFGGNRGGMGGMGAGGMGMGGMIAGTLLASVAGTFIGTAIADQFFANDTGFDNGGFDGGADAGADPGIDAPVDEVGADTMVAEDPGFDSGFDDMGGDFGGFEG